MPIINRLKKREYQEIALFQDTIIDILYNIDDQVILHGGTTVWRCFGGSRFSNDIDAYLNKNIGLNEFKKQMSLASAKQGIKLEKIKDTGNIIFMGFLYGNTYIKVELNHISKIPTFIPTRFERSDGTFIDVLSLTPNSLILEKIAAYNDRRFIRDIYDIYILINYAKIDEELKTKIKRFVSTLQFPVNEDDLDNIIYEGPTPTFNGMVDYISGKL